MWSKIKLIVLPVKLTCGSIVSRIRGDDIDNILRVESELPGLQLSQEL